MNVAVWIFLILFYVEDRPVKREIVATSTKHTCEIVRVLLTEELSRAEQLYPRLRVEISNKCEKSTDMFGESL